jgi:hypothetical protein
MIDNNLLPAAWYHGYHDGEIGNPSKDDATRDYHAGYRSGAASRRKNIAAEPTRYLWSVLIDEDADVDHRIKAATVLLRFGYLAGVDFAL